jgi:sugar phosphate isomerase/epimerase
MTGHGPEVLDTLKAVAGKCRLMSINGVDVASKKYILPLGQGDFDLARFLAVTKSSGYQGAVGLQGYGVPGDPLDNLKKSMEAWKKAQPL